jgi:hypothetical protein
MVVVTMTSWPRRIGSVGRVVRSVMAGTVVPDRLYLNLSLKEFPEKERGLPEDLVGYFGSDGRLAINWVPGENTRSMKKVFPVLKYLGDDDIVMTADDDMLFPKDLLECRLADFESAGSEHPVSSSVKTSVGFHGRMKVVQVTSLFRKRMLANWERFVTPAVMRTYNDDRTYLHLFWLNGYTNVACTRWTVSELLNDRSVNLMLPDGMGENKVHLIGRNYDGVVMREMKGNVYDMFGYYRNNKI